MSSFRHLCLAALAALTLCACGPKEPIQLGFISGQTGGFSDLGTSGLHGAMLAVELRNAAGGIDGRPITLLVRDDQHNAARARLAMQSLLSQDVVAIIGPMTSTMATELVPLADAQHTLLMGGTVVSSSLSGKDDQFLRIVADTRVYGGNTARFQREVLGVTRAAVLFDVANRDYSQDWAQSYAQEFQRRGGAQVDLIPFDSRNAGDMSLPTQTALQRSPQMVTLVCSAKSAATLARNLRRRNPTIQLAAAAWAANEQLIEQGETAVEGMHVEQYHDLGDRSESYQRFYQAFTARFSRPPDYAAVVAYDATSIVLDALLITDKRADLKAAIIRQGQFRGLQGGIVIDANGDAMRTAYMSEIRQKKFQALSWHAKP